MTCFGRRQAGLSDRYVDQRELGQRRGATVPLAENLKDGPRLTRESEHFGNDTRLIMSASKEYTLFIGRWQPFPMQGSLRGMRI